MPSAPSWIIHALQEVEGLVKISKMSASVFVFAEKSLLIMIKLQ